MSMSVSALSNPISYLQQLLQQGTAGASGADPLTEIMQTLSGATPSADPLTSQSSVPGSAGSTGFSPFGSDTMAALISMQGQPPSGASPSQMFATFDSNGDGQISKAEFDSAFSQAGVDSATTDAAFAKLDANGDGSISQSELASAKRGHGHHHHNMEGGGETQASGSSSQSALDSLLSETGADGATTKTATNADGSNTTTISYADGTAVDMTTPAAAASGGTSNTGTGNQSSANLLEELIKMQSQMLTAATSTLSAIV